MPRDQLGTSFYGPEIDVSGQNFGNILIGLCTIGRYNCNEYGTFYIDSDCCIATVGIIWIDSP